MTPDTADPADFIRRNLAVRPVAGRPDICIYTAHPGSGIARLGGETPYWAYAWPGGAALAQHFAADPASVRGKTVLDLGAGSGLVGIAAALAGARRVICSETLPEGRAAITLNAALNAVAVEVAGDVTRGSLPDADVIAAGDTFYDRRVAGRMLAFLRAAEEAGKEVLVGDIGRAYLPLGELEPLAPYPVRDFGDGADAPEKQAMVYRWRSQP